MALGAIALRCALSLIIYGIFWICQGVDITGETRRRLAEILTTVFPTSYCSWYLASAMWAILLVARYCRQAIRQENTTWRRHALVDFLLWLLSWSYWAGCMNGLFLEDPSQLVLSPVMGVAILSEEIIRFYFAERMYCFYQCFMEYSQLVMYFWHFVCAAACALILAGTGLFAFVCVLHLDPVPQVKNSLIMAGLFWISLVLFRYVTLYLRILRRDHRNGAMFADETTDAALYIV